MGKAPLIAIASNFFFPMKIPESPKKPGPFKEQYGYGEIKVKTHKYHDKPTATAAHQTKTQEFITSKTDNEHKKKYAKRFFGFLVQVLCK